MQNTKIKLFWALLLVCGLTAAPDISLAQGNFEEEFKNFREKLQDAKVKAAESAPAAPAESAAPAAAEPPTENTSAASLPSPIEGIVTPSISPPSSPLGPAADLPLGPAAARTLAPALQTPEQLQMMMEAELETQKAKIEQQTFDAALKNLLPLAPGQIRTTLKEFSKSREAAETPITVPTPKQAVETVSLDPSDAPVIVRMAPGYVTTLIILDSTGAPWPVQDFSWAGKFDVTPPEEGGHVIRITPLTAHGVGNISIRMVDLITPITMQLVTGLEEVYYRLDARIPKPGPLAKTPIIEYGGLQSVAGTDDYMVGVLDGTPPSSAAKMKVKGVDGQTSAWRVDETVYLRTPLTLLSPGWNASVSSADGMNVYSLNNAPVVLLSDRGRMVRAQIVENEVSP